jgi:hypothetical protein
MFYVHDDGRKTRTLPAADASSAVTAAAAAPAAATAAATAAAAAAAAKAVEAEAEAAPLPSGWRRVTSKASGTTYFVHCDGRKTRRAPT